jgi:hypothetical protein
MKNLIIAPVLLIAATLGGCSFNARGPADYKKDTRALLETRDKDIKACYDTLLKDDKEAKGSVVLTFTVKAKTGEFSDVKIADKGTSAPDALKSCVLDAVKGLKLDPPDERDGKATFTYEFKQK